MRNTLYKSYLEDFHRFCAKIGGATGELMCDLLSFEADRRSINITLNSLGTDLSREDRRRLYPDLGLLQGVGQYELANSDDQDQIRAVLEKFHPFQQLLGRMSYGETAMMDKVRTGRRDSMRFLCTSVWK